MGGQLLFESSESVCGENILEFVKLSLQRRILVSLAWYKVTFLANPALKLIASKGIQKLL